MSIHKTSLLMLVLMGSTVFHTTTASAASFGCESVGGSVILKDTLYGALTGAVLSGLVLLASGDGGGDAGAIVAASTAGGGVLGLGLGIAEVAYRDCPPRRFSEEKGFHSSIVALPTNSGKFGSAVKLSWNF
ncbi:MAG: hypothetical protein EOP14_07660 [Pseudomonas sp.]|nr:MAG: hypothetical protein EOP14_07660 [Pseudomonas sp.]